MRPLASLPHWLEQQLCTICPDGGDPKQSAEHLADGLQEFGRECLLRGGLAVARAVDRGQAWVDDSFANSDVAWAPLEIGELALLKPSPERRSLLEKTIGGAMHQGMMQNSYAFDFPGTGWEPGTAICAATNAARAVVEEDSQAARESVERALYCALRDCTLDLRRALCAELVPWVQGHDPLLERAGSIKTPPACPPPPPDRWAEAWALRPLRWGWLRRLFSGAKGVVEPRSREVLEFLGLHDGERRDHFESFHRLAAFGFLVSKPVGIRAATAAARVVLPPYCGLPGRALAAAEAWALRPDSDLQAVREAKCELQTRSWVSSALNPCVAPAHRALWAVLQPKLLVGEAILAARAVAGRFPIVATVRAELLDWAMGWTDPLEGRV